MADNPETDEGGGDFDLTTPIGPLPLWGWMGIVLALVVLYSQWRKNKAAAKPASTATPATSTTDQTPPFIIQNYTQTTPGPAGATGPAGPTGATGPAGGPSIGPTVPSPLPPVHAPVTVKPMAYRVKPGDTLDKIASANHVAGGGQTLFEYNIGTGPFSAHRSAQDIATLKQRGPNLLYSNEVIYIPQQTGT